MKNIKLKKKLLFQILILIRPMKAKLTFPHGKKWIKDIYYKLNIYYICMLETKKFFSNDSLTVTGNALTSEKKKPKCSFMYVVIMTGCK